MGFGNYRQIGMWDAFDLLQLQQPPGYRHRASTDVHAMRMIWEWLEKHSRLICWRVTGLMTSLVKTYFKQGGRAAKIGCPATSRLSLSS